MDATCLSGLFILFAAFLHQSTAVFPISKKYDDSNPEGVPGVDYPIYRSVPRGLPFSCHTRKPGFYADPDTDCQVWHICDLHGRRYSFLCANKTVFNQYNRGCDWWYNVNCDASEDLYSNNDDVFKSNRLGDSHAINFGPRPHNRVQVEVPSSNRVDIPRENRPVPAVTASPPPPPTRRPAVPARTKTPRPLLPLDPGRAVTFQIIRRPVTTTSPPTFDVNDEFVRPSRPRPALGPFRPPPPPPPPPAQTEFENEATFAPSGQALTEGPPSSWTVHFIAGNANRNGQPFIDQSWRLAHDQERAFPTQSPVGTNPPNDIGAFSTTRRAPHGFSTVEPFEQEFIPPRRTRLPPKPTQRPTESVNEFPVEASTPQFIQQNRISTPATFGSRSSPDWDTSSVEAVSFPNNNEIVNIQDQNDNTFDAEKSDETSANEFQGSLGSFGNRDSQISDVSENTFQNPSTQEVFRSSPAATIPPVHVTVNDFSVSSTNAPLSGHSDQWWSSPQENASPASVHDDNQWSTPQTNVQNDNLLTQTDQSVFIPPEVPSDLRQVSSTRRPAKITTYHPQRFVPEISTPTANQIADNPSSTQHPVIRTTRRRVVKTTTVPPATTTTATTRSPTPRPKAVTFSDDSSNPDEPSIPLVFGTRLNPKKTFRVDNDASASNLDPSTALSENEEPAQVPESDKLYDLPVIADEQSEIRDKSEDSLPIN